MLALCIALQEAMSGPSSGSGSRVPTSVEEKLTLGVDIWKMRDIANKFEISNVQIMHLTSMGKLCEFPFLDVDDVDFLNVLLEKGGNRSEFVFHVDEEEKSYLIVEIIVKLYCIF